MDNLKPNELGYGDCCLCDGYVLDLEDCPFCPTCARMPYEERKAIFIEWAERLRTASTGGR